MEIDFLVKGLVIGFSIAAPVGPIGVLCIRRTLAEGLTVGFLSGLGAATADAIYGSIAGFGLTFISGFLLRQQLWLSLVGGLFLCYLGFKTYRTSPASRSASPAIKSSSLATAYASTFFLTLTNPATVLSFAVVFAGLGLGVAGRPYPAAAVLVAGVFLGSAAWWLLLSSGVNALRTRFDGRQLRWVNRLAGVVIAGFGLLALGSLLR